MELQVITGKHKLDYKPSVSDYSIAIERLMEKECIGSQTFKETMENSPDLAIKCLYLLIKYWGSREILKACTDEGTIRTAFKAVSSVCDMVGCLTPREFMRMFPIEKSYDGDKYGAKDYFYTYGEIVNEHGMDSLIGERSSEFLMDYMNIDISKFMGNWMGIVNRMHKINGGRDILVEFAESQGKKLTLYRAIDENTLLDKESGEIIKVHKPKKRVPKFIEVVK